MLDKNTATIRIARQVQDLEANIADNLESATGLLHSMALANRDVGGAGKAGHAAMLRAKKIIEAQLTAQAEVMRVHAELLNISVIVNGPASPEGCPEYKFIGSVEGAAAA